MANDEHVRMLVEDGVRVWNQWRKDNPDETPDLIEANLSEKLIFKADLRGAYLNGANLCGTNLNEADLCGAKLLNAELITAKLMWANLSKADLRYANLSGAKLDNADLERTKLNWAKLQGADFTAAMVDGGTQVRNCEVDENTNFALVGLGDMRIDSGTRQLLEYNLRRKRWNAWCDQQPPWKGRLVRLFWFFSDYGTSILRLVKSFIILAIFFASVYYVWGAVDYCFLDINDNPGIVKNLFVVAGEEHSVTWCEAPIRAIYFSVVTMTTLGFGDMYAKATSNNGDWYAITRCFFGYLLLMLQVLLGYVLLGALVTRLSILFSAGGPAGNFVKMDKGTKARLDEIRKKEQKEKDDIKRTLVEQTRMLEKRETEILKKSSPEQSGKTPEQE